MVQVAKLSADLTANTTSFETGLKRADAALRSSKAQWNSALSQSSRNFSAFGSSVQSSLSSVTNLQSQLGGFAAATAAAFSVQRVISYSDTYKQLEGRLKLATDSAEQFATVQKQLFDVSQRTSTPLAANIEAYARLSQALNDTQKKQFDLVGITETLSQTLLISGTSGQNASELIRQFGQAASSDFKAVGQEIGTIADQAPRLLKVLNDAFAGSGKTLKQLAADGELSTQKILEALKAAAPQIAKEATGMGDTVTKAFTRLDNAFLNFIGQSDLVKNGTSSIAGAVGGLADNFDKLAVVAGVVAAAFAGKFAASLITTAELTAVNLAQTIAYQAALARMAGVSATAAVGMTALSGAATLLSTALAAVGGPIGVALIATLGSIYIHTKNIREAQEKLNAEVDGFKTSAQGYINASADMRKKIEGDINARIAGYRAEATQLAILASKMDGQNVMARLLREAGNVVGVSTNSGEVRDRALALAEAAKQLQTVKDGLGKETATAANDSIAVTDKQKKSVDSLLASLKQESDEAKLQASLYGQKESVINRAVKAKQIENQLAKDGIKLTADQQAQINAYLDGIERSTAAVSGLKSAKKEVNKEDEKRVDIFRQLQDETSELKAQTDAYGQKASAVSRAAKEQEIANKLAADGITLSKAQQDQLNSYLDDFERQTELQKKQSAEQKRAEEQDKNRRRAMDELGASFKSAFEDAIVEGEKFGDVLSALFKDIERLLLRKSITEPLVNAIAGSGAGSGFLSGIGDFLFGGGVPSHATGIDYVPRDMMARIHKGEAVVPASEAKAMRAGGGGDVVVNITNNAGAAVSSSTRQTSSGTELNVMIDQAVADNIARPGSKTNQALAAQSGRSLVRR